MRTLIHVVTTKTTIVTNIKQMIYRITHDHSVNTSIERSEIHVIRIALLRECYGGFQRDDNPPLLTFYELYKYETQLWAYYQSIAKNKQQCEHLALTGLDTLVWQHIFLQISYITHPF